MKPLIDPINTSDGQFHDYDPQTGEEATIVTSVYANDTQAATRSTQREVISILTAAGIKPAEATNDQLLTALKALFLAEDDTRVSGALQKDKNLSDLTDATKAKEALSLDKVGNFVAVQQGGGTGMKDNKVYVGWDGKKLIAQVDDTLMGELFYNNNPPPYPVTSVNAKTGAVTLGKSDVGLGNVGNYAAVQQGGGIGQVANKIYLGWGTDGVLRFTVDETDEGAIYSTNNPPPYPVTSVNGLTGAISIKDGFSTDGTGMNWNSAVSSLQLRIGTFTLAATAGASVTVTFPSAFANGCLIVIPVPDLSVGVGAASAEEQIGCTVKTSTYATLTKGIGDNSARGGVYMAVGW